jgi:hypothetical protein
MKRTIMIKRFPMMLPHIVMGCPRTGRNDILKYEREQEEEEKPKVETAHFGK